MLVEHRLSMSAKCPANGKVDDYEVVFRLSDFIAVEALIVEVLRHKNRKIYQEHLTQELADFCQGEVVTDGVHSGVKTRVTCQPRKVRRKK